MEHITHYFFFFALPSPLCMDAWNTLFASEEIFRVNLAFHLNQSLEIALEILHTPIPSLRITCVCMLVNA
jgi:hypothetical protein